jgi:hypothetical protein
MVIILSGIKKIGKSEVVIRLINHYNSWGKKFFETAESPIIHPKVASANIKEGRKVILQFYFQIYI